MMGHGVSALLVTAAVGYWVLTHAEKEKQGGVRKLGQYLGLLIIIVSVFGAACKIYYQINGYPPGRMGMMGKMACPMTGKAMGGAAACPAGHPGCTMNCPPGGK
ncbi:MAG: hypothetical protein HYZ88_03260 [Candidatus Omnitrophica bacterium]|nr:hypothetical protein [Candidatus Omnitrophota bacterium]